jgi:hypothetical protein
MVDLMMGEATCQVRIDGIIDSVNTEYHFIAGIVRHGNENLLIVQRANSLWMGRQIDLVHPDLIPREVLDHSSIKRWNDVEFRPATVEEAQQLLSGKIPTRRAFGLGYQPMFMSA